MNLNKFTPLGFKCMQLFTSCKRINFRAFNIKQLGNVQRKLFNIQIYATLAFIWPVKKNDSQEKIDHSQSVLERADILFENGHHEDCYQLLRECKTSNNVEIEWRMCRALYNMAKESRYDGKTKKDFILEAYKIISDQLQYHEEHFAVHKWYALLLDAKSSYDGLKERIKQLENVKTHMDLAVTLNPNDATTLHMLGEWCYQVTEMPWHQRKIAETFFAELPYSNYEDALEYFLRAETAQPRFYSLNLLRIGNCYLKMKKEDQAKYYLKLAASYPAKCNDDHRANKEAAELLKKLK